MKIGNESGSVIGSGSVIEEDSGRQQSVSGGATGFSRRTLFGTIPACVIFARSVSAILGFPGLRKFMSESPAGRILPAGWKRDDCIARQFCTGG